MLAHAMGYVLAFLVGALCRRYDVPLPAPPKLLGAVLVVVMTLGYLAGGEAL